MASVVLDPPAERVGEAAAMAPRPSLFRQLWLWLKIGIQSFGGGHMTNFMMRRVFVEQGRWLTDDEFARFWAMCQLAPGMHVLSLAMLIGRRLAGWPGVVVASIGLMAPSVALTLIITASFAEIRDWPVLAGGLRGVVAAAVGIGVFMTWQVARPVLRQARLGGVIRLAPSLGILLVAAGLALAIPSAIVPTLLGGGVLGALINWRLSRG